MYEMYCLPYHLYACRCFSFRGVAVAQEAPVREGVVGEAAVA